MEDDNNFQPKDKYTDKQQYSKINKKIVENERKKHLSKQKETWYAISIKLYKYRDTEGEEYVSSYLEIPNNYSENLAKLIKKKEDIFTKGKILTFKTQKGPRDFSFDAVVEKSDKSCVFIVPIKEQLRNNLSSLLGNYNVKERSGDLTYERMSIAIDEFVGPDCMDPDVERAILGQGLKWKFLDVFDYNKSFDGYLDGLGSIGNRIGRRIENVLVYPVSTVLLSKSTGLKTVCFIIDAIFRMRRNYKDKILVCSSSNLSADMIAMDLLRADGYNEYYRFLRVYAKNQELIRRQKNLYINSLHGKLREEIWRERNCNQHKKGKKSNEITSKKDIKNWIIDNSNIIISTCVNSYCDDLINYEFPFVIIVNADNSTEQESLIPITLKVKHVTLISYEGNETKYDNLYKRMKRLYPAAHFKM